MSDLLLDEALNLAEQAHCVIVPCDYRYWRPLANDPRVLLYRCGDDSVLFTRQLVEIVERVVG